MRDYIVAHLINLALCLALLTSNTHSQLAALAGNIISTDEVVGEVVDIGKSNTNLRVMPSNQLPINSDLWVDAASGNDSNDGLTHAAAFRSIQRAANIAGPGTTVHILPGIYRETVQPM